MGSTEGALPGWRDEDLIAPLLILFLGVALGICLVGVLLVLHYLRSDRLEGRRSARPPERWPRERRLSPLPVSLPSRWLAVRCAHPHLVQAALRLHNPAPCSWEEGLCASHEHKLFISPAIGGWVLVMGAPLPEPAEDVDKCFRFIVDLSRKIGQVQYFSLNRALNHHAWVQTDNGRVVRAYAWGGRTLWNQGRLTRAEAELGLTCFAYGEPTYRTFNFGHQEAIATNTERLPWLASRWSVDPAAVDPRCLRETHGIAGELSRFKLH
jgi:hypothetical protein